jgi:hypothetical protein
VSIEAFVALVFPQASGRILFHSNLLRHGPSHGLDAPARRLRSLGEA